MNNSIAVRPSLHLNLTSSFSSSAAETSAIPTPSLKENEFEYNGSAWYVDTANQDGSAGVANFLNYDSEKMTVTYDQNGQTNPGIYTVVFEIIDADSYIFKNGSTMVICTWQIVPKQTYSITLNFERDTNSESTAVAFATITKVDKDGNSLDKDWSEILDTKNPTITVTHLADGYYSIKVTASTNHVATIGNIRYGTSTNDLILNVIVVQNNYGGFYANSTSHTTLTNTKVNGVVSVLSLSGGEVKTISSGLTTITEYNIKNIVLLTAFVTATTTLLIVSIVYLAKRKNKKKTIKYVMYK